MPLKLLPLEEADFSTLLQHADTGEVGDDLVAPPYPIAWPVSTRAEAQTRARHSFALLKRRFLHDPTINFIKVVDEDNAGDIVAVARWHFYPRGYDYETEKHWELLPTSSSSSSAPDRVVNGDGDGEVAGAAAEVYPPPNLDIDLFAHILTFRDTFRARWIPAGKPCWILMNVVTRPSQRRRGAASMLTRWGQEQAERAGASAYLEAGAQGLPVYAKFGFRPATTHRFDLRGFRTPVGPFEMIFMAWHPGGGEKADVGGVEELDSVKAVAAQAQVEVPTSSPSVQV